MLYGLPACLAAGALPFVDPVRDGARSASASRRSTPSRGWPLAPNRRSRWPMRVVGRDRPGLAISAAAAGPCRRARLRRAAVTMTRPWLSTLDRRRRVDPALGRGVAGPTARRRRRSHADGRRVRAATSTRSARSSTRPRRRRSSPRPACRRGVGIPKATERPGSRADDLRAADLVPRRSARLHRARHRVGERSPVEGVLRGAQGRQGLGRVDLAPEPGPRPRAPGWPTRRSRSGCA